LDKACSKSECDLSATMIVGLLLWFTSKSDFNCSKKAYKLVLIKISLSLRVRSPSSALIVGKATGA